MFFTDDNTESGSLTFSTTHLCIVVTELGHHQISGNFTLDPQNIFCQESDKIHLVSCGQSHTVHYNREGVNLSVSAASFFRKTLHKADRHAAGSLPLGETGGILDNSISFYA